MRGEHEIVPDTPPARPRITRREWAILLGIGLLLATGLGIGAWQAPVPEPLAAPSHLPAAPPNRVGVVEARSPVGAAPLRVILGSDRYALHYVTVADVSALPVKAGDPGIYWADFASNTSQGRSAGADVLVLVGDLSLRVGDIGRHDALGAQIAQAGPAINAHFDYATSPRGPPSRLGLLRPRPPVTKTIYVIGRMTRIDIGDAREESRRDIEVLDLEPGPQAVADYERRLQEWQQARPGATTLKSREQDAESPQHLIER